MLYIFLYISTSEALMIQSKWIGEAIRTAIAFFPLLLSTQSCSDPEPMFADSDISIIEGSSDEVIVWLSSSPSVGSLEIGLVIVEDEMGIEKASNNDYELSSRTLLFKQNENKKTFTVTAIKDDEKEDEETIVINFFDIENQKNYTTKMTKIRIRIKDKPS